MVQKLSDRLSKAFMFSALNPEEFKIILDAIQKIDKSAGETIINQGDNGDNLYVVEAGQLICTRIEPGTQEQKVLREYVPGEVFGELALLYNAPRAATITAK